MTTHREALDEGLRARLDAVCEEGWRYFEKFDLEVRGRQFHPFIAADYEIVLESLIPLRAPGRRFLEWGSASGIITIMADILGFEAYGIELDPELVKVSREMAARFDSKARFVAGSFIPSGYRWQPADGDGRTGTVGSGLSGYVELGLMPDDFDVLYVFPWSGEEAMLVDLMNHYGNPDSILLVNSVNDGVRTYKGGKDITGKR